jgi:hypothetical protein
MDFDLASKHKKDVEKRRKEAKRKLDEQRREEALAASLEAEKAARETERAATHQAAVEAALEVESRSGGIRFYERLCPFPSTRTDDKLTLPPSVLEKLERQGAIDGAPLTFEISVSGFASGQPTTHAGVAEFTAEEGTVGIPPKVALCLTKAAGHDTLAAVGSIELRFSKLARCAKCQVSFQPRGHGFHQKGANVVNIDLKAVLEQTLVGHTALSVGDWLPVRHDGVTYELIVKELEPQPHLLLLNTEVTVDILPSEVTEAELEAAEEAKKRAEERRLESEKREAERLANAKRKAAQLPDEPSDPASAIRILIRLPTGGTIKRSFTRDAPLRHVMDWVEAEPTTGAWPDEFRLVQKWPGHCRELGGEEGTKTLQELGFARQEALFFQTLHEGEEDINEQEDAEKASREAREAIEAAMAVDADTGSKTDAWKQAEEQAKSAMDSKLAGERSPSRAAGDEASFEGLQGQELVDVFQHLVALGMSPQKAAPASKRFGSQLKELAEMGFQDWIAAVNLLEKYNGRLLRVANLLSEQALEAGQPFVPAAGPFEPAGGAASTSPEESATAAAPAQSSPATSAPSAPTATKPAVPDPAELKAAITAKFKELVASGTPPTEAATLAIQLVKEEAAQKAKEQAEAEAAAAAAAAAEAAPKQEQAGERSLDLSAQLAELEAMGFCDTTRNISLLQKYPGRMERVIDALCSS